MSVLLHIEVVQREYSCLPKNELLQHVKKEVSDGLIPAGANIKSFSNPVLNEHVESIAFSGISCEDEVKAIDLKNANIQYYIYQLNTEGQQAEEMEGGDGRNEELTAANHWILPSSDFHGLWETLIYDSSIKENLLNFVETTMLFSDHKVDTNIISWNRVVLLHGPPGTGKTSLCKALAQKLAIRLGHRYTHGELIEINSHSLFSKWFSESGKLVMKMFAKIQEYIEDPDALVCILIDEVESLTHARQSALSGTEPSDSLRVVNAVLTEIDRFRRFPNVLVLTTSNITNAIDVAFVDRADIKQYIGPPSVYAIYKIYQSCILELKRTGIVTSIDDIVPLKFLQLSPMPENSAMQLSVRLLEISRKSEGLSGRTLRKIPFLAHAYYVQSPQVSLEDFIVAMHKAVIKQLKDRTELEQQDTSALNNIKQKSS
ncbi:pachytene checkpoint protein 2 homolog [Periplaneta americana]|uniref:pachytene checkpoint protein 2 homolog n=1 Tax=Periplaneta americana TaxID=6978 RepID=UPI0037E8E192